MTSMCAPAAGSVCGREPIMTSWYAGAAAWVSGHSGAGYVSGELTGDIMVCPSSGGVSGCVEGGRSWRHGVRERRQSVRLDLAIK